MFRAFASHRLLKALLEQDTPLTLEQLQHRTGLAAAQLEALLLPLEERGWVGRLVEVLEGQGLEECWRLSDRGRTRAREALGPVPLVFRLLRGLRRV